MNLPERRHFNTGHTMDAVLGWNACLDEVKRLNIKCDGDHGGPRCADPGCWNDDPRAGMVNVVVAPAPNDACHIPQPHWGHVFDAFVAGAREARANPGAPETMFTKAADGYSKLLLLELSGGAVTVAETIPPLEGAAERNDSDGVLGRQTTEEKKHGAA